MATIIKVIKASDLDIRREVQRVIQDDQVKFLAQNWEDQFVGVLTAWEYTDADGVKHTSLLDGQQRWAAKTGSNGAGKVLDRAGIKPDPSFLFTVLVHKDIPLKVAAQIFLAANRGRKNVDSYSRWWVEKTAGDEVALTMEAAVIDAGYEISSDSSLTKGHVGCVATMRRIIERRTKLSPSAKMYRTIEQNRESLAWAVSIYPLIYAHQGVQAWRSEFVEALAALHVRYGTKIDEGRLIKRVGSIPQDKTYAAARAKAVGNNRILTTLTDEFRAVYDGGLRSDAKRLEPNKTADDE